MRTLRQDVECLIAVCEIKSFLDKGVYSSTDWSECVKGKGFRTDMGYFYEGLNGLEEFLIESIRGKVCKDGKIEWDKELEEN